MGDQGPKNTIRAGHGVEISFIFISTRIDPLVGGDLAAHLLAERINRSWGAFVRAGNPEGDGGLGPWPRYAAANQHTMIITNVSSVASDPDGRLLDLLDSTGEETT